MAQQLQSTTNSQEASTRTGRASFCVGWPTPSLGAATPEEDPVTQSLIRKVDAALTKGDVAEQFGVSHRTVTRLIEAGTLRAFKVGGQVRILSSEVDRYVARQMKTGVR